MQRKREFMPDEVWETILHKYVVPYWRLNDHLNPPTVSPNKDGEPLIDKKLRRRLRQVADLLPGMTLSIYTHGLLLTRDFIDFLGSLPNRVRLMVTFHFYNHDGSENDYTRTTALLHQTAHNKPGNVELILSSHLHPPMTSERLRAWKESWAGAPNLTVHANVSINPWTGLIDSPNASHFGMCPYESFHTMFFGATGNIVACCMDLEEEIIFGNVMKDDPAEMVRVVGEFYAAQKRHEPRFDVCNNCFGLPPRQKRKLIQLGVR